MAPPFNSFKEKNCMHVTTNRFRRKQTTLHSSAVPAKIVRIKMGIKKLLATLRPSRQPVDLRMFAGQKVGIDVSCWVHRFGVRSDYRGSEASNATA